MRIRKIKKEDYEQVKALEIQVHKLHNKARSDVFKKDESGVLNHEHFLDILNNPKYCSFVCMHENKIVGELLAFIKTGTPAPFMKNRKILYIESLCVDASMRHKGVGTKLINHAKKLAKLQGCEAIELNVWAFNNNAIEFYKAQGMSVKTMVYEAKL